MRNGAALPSRHYPRRVLAPARTTDAPGLLRDEVWALVTDHVWWTNRCGGSVKGRFARSAPLSCFVVPKRCRDAHHLHGYRVGL